MRNGNIINKEIRLIEVSIEDIMGVVEKHINNLTYPMDSWLEDRLIKADKYKLMFENACIGYAGFIKESLCFFHVMKEYFKYAPYVFEKIIQEKDIKRVFIMTQDSLLSTLIAEWDYEKEKQACWFTDSERIDSSITKMDDAVFRVAKQKDIHRIREISGDFFDEASGGFAILEDRIEAETIFVLEDKTSFLGCGIIEKGRFCKGVISIGMFVSREHRRKGVAKKILLNLKEWVYSNDLKPVAGCWYYNTLSRKSLEAAGMIVTSIGYEAILIGKEKLPLRTGNPPGELVK